MTSTLRAIRSSTARTCWAASAWVGPIIQASTPSSLPAFLIPASMALNHGMPPIFTTTAIWGFLAWASAWPAAPGSTPAAATPPTRASDARLVIIGFSTTSGTFLRISC